MASLSMASLPSALSLTPVLALLRQGGGEDPREGDQNWFAFLGRGRGRRTKT